jgi:hypothetical protein
MKKLLSRTIKIGIVLNLPPLFLKLMLLAKLDIFPFIFSALLWANIPLQYLGIGSLFDSSQLTWGEFGVSQASPIVWSVIVLFWLIVAALISYVSLLGKVRVERN